MCRPLPRSSAGICDWYQWRAARGAALDAMNVRDLLLFAARVPTSHGRWRCISSMPVDRTDRNPTTIRWHQRRQPVATRVRPRSGTLVRRSRQAAGSAVPPDRVGGGARDTTRSRRVRGPHRRVGRVVRGPLPTPRRLKPRRKGFGWSLGPPQPSSALLWSSISCVNRSQRSRCSCGISSPLGTST